MGTSRAGNALMSWRERVRGFLEQERLVIEEGEEGAG